MHGAFLEFPCCNWCSYKVKTCVSGKFGSHLKEVKPLVVYDGEQGIVLEPMQGNWAASRVDFGYTEIFHIPVVTSVSFYTCEGFLGDSLQFRQANQSSLPV